MTMVTVLIPTFNRKEYVVRAVQSVLAQTYAGELEIIVIDDGSTDGTEELFRAQLDSRIRYERLPTNQGVHMARNRGLDIARGELIAFLDSDDEFFPTTLEKAVAVFDANPGIGLVLAPYVMEKDGSLSAFERTVSGELPFTDLLCEVGVRKHKGGFFMVRKSVVGSTRWEVPYLMFLFLRYVGKRTRIYYIAEPLGIYHFLMQAQSVSRLRRKPNQDLSIRRSRALVRFLDEFGDDLLRDCPSHYSWYAYGAAVGLLLDGKTKEARRYAGRAARYQPRSVRYVSFFLFSWLPGAYRLFRVAFRYATTHPVSFRPCIDRFVGNRWVRLILLGDRFADRWRLFVYRSLFWLCDRLKRPSMFAKSRKVHLQFRGSRFPFEIGGALDVALLNDIFIDQEYALALDRPPRMIFDLGSNVGASVLYFHALFPDAHIYAFEPDPQNLEILRRNVTDIGPRVLLFPQAIYHKDKQSLALYRNAKSHWSTSLVQKDGAGELFHVQTVSLDAAMAHAGVQVIDVLKFDIEGAEFDVFRTFSGLDRVRYLIGEFHPHLCGKTLEEFLALFPQFALVRKSVGQKHSIVFLKNTRMPVDPME